MRKIKQFIDYIKKGNDSEALKCLNMELDLKTYEQILKKKKDIAKSLFPLKNKIKK